VKEKPFLVLNINRKELVALAEKYKQDCVIFGVKDVFYLIRNGRTVKKGRLGYSDDYFKVNGKKFSIKFSTL